MAGSALMPLVFARPAPRATRAIWRRSSISVIEVMKSDESCRKSLSRKGSPDTLRLGLVFRRLRNDKLKHVATARPLYLRGAERGVSIRRVIRYSVALRNSARNRFPLTVTLVR